jgi:hypothetical protein
MKVNKDYLQKLLEAFETNDVEDENIRIDN